MLTSTRVRFRTDEQRQAYNAYQREYRRRNPDKARKWQQDYIIRKAVRLLEAERAGATDAGD